MSIMYFQKNTKKQLEFRTSDYVNLGSAKNLGNMQYICVERGGEGRREEKWRGDSEVLTTGESRCRCSLFFPGFGANCEISIVKTRQGTAICITAHFCETE